MSAGRGLATPTGPSLPGDAQRTAAIVERGRRVLRMERDALEEIERRLGEEFARAVLLIQRSLTLRGVQVPESVDTYLREHPGRPPRDLVAPVRPAQ